VVVCLCMVCVGVGVCVCGVCGVCVCVCGMCVCVSNFRCYSMFKNEVSATVAVSVTQNTCFSSHSASPLTNLSLHHSSANDSNVVFTAFCIASYNVQYYIVCCNLMKVTVQFIISFYKYTL